MTDTPEIRDSAPEDLAALERLYPAAFPDEDLLPVVRELLKQESGVLSLVAPAKGDIVANVIFTTCGLTGQPGKVEMLAPLAVAPHWQRRGLGTAIVGEGLRRLEGAGTTRVFVLGDPAYYGRFGFQPDFDVAPPYPLAEEWLGAWQSLGLGGAPPLKGELSVPGPWRREALWTP